MKKNTKLEKGIKKTLTLGAIPPEGWHDNLTATEKECDEIAKRLDIPKVKDLNASINVTFQDDIIRVLGHLNANLIRQCVVSLELCPEVIDTDFESLFAEEVNVSAKETQMKEAIEPIINGRLDFFDILSEQVGLNMDPFPHKSGIQRDYIEFDKNQTHKPFANLKNMIKKD